MKNMNLIHDSYMEDVIYPKDKGILEEDYYEGYGQFFGKQYIGKQYEKFKKFENAEALRWYSRYSDLILFAWIFREYHSPFIFHISTWNFKKMSMAPKYINMIQIINTIDNYYGYGKTDFGYRLFVTI